MNSHDVQLLKSLPLEARARLQKKSFSPLCLLFIALGIGVGLYYWFGRSFLFSYSTVKPFWGFVLFSTAGIVLAFIIFVIITAHYKEYNSTIDSALSEIKQLVDEGNSDSLDQYLLHKSILIESKVGSGNITSDEFKWYTTHFCWGCGKKHQERPKRYIVSREKEESWRSGPYRKYQRFSINAPILLCPDCYKKIKESESNKKRIDHVRRTTSFIICGVLTITLFIVCIVTQEFDFRYLVGGIFVSAAIFVALSTFGQIILYPLSCLITAPFLKNLKTFKPYLSLDDIPVVKD